jgi:tRNA threonylcarbamoyladenosine biosynthesis protein TsaB
MILLIDTSQESGMVALAKEGRVILSEENKIAKEHAGWLHPAIGRLLASAKITVRELSAVAVVEGPGSYTGLRVGMAAAKGFCYALKIPLITGNSLVLMAEAMKEEALENNALICPMIDARRDEVFTALYMLDTANRQPPTANYLSANRQRPTANDLMEILPPQAMILDKNVFDSYLSGNRIIFSGTGAVKLEKMINQGQAIFRLQNSIIQSFAISSLLDFEAGRWADPVLSAPVYLKEFFSY